MRSEQTVSEMAEEALSRQAEAHALRTAQPLAEALEAVLETPAGRRLGELGSGSHQDEEVRYWQANLLFERASERVRQGRAG
jgi:erythromycin esterase-like protein